VIVLGDQLEDDSAGFDGFDAEQDAVWMAGVAEESTQVWSHKARIAVFLSAMRHFRDALRQRSVTVHYRQLDEAGNHGTFVGELTATVSRLCPQKLIVVEPGEWRVRESLQTTARALGLELGLLEIAWVRSAALVVGLLPVTVGGLGLREGTVVALLAVFGVSSADALSLSLLAFTVTVLGVGVVGGLSEAAHLIRRH
jgi:hypothetical protein